MTEFTAALSTISGNVADMGGALVGLSAVAIAFWVAIKFIKKIPKAAG